MKGAFHLLQQPDSAAKFRATIAITALVILLSSAVLLWKIRTTPFVPDESGWISSGLYYSNLLLNLDFTPKNWECAACEGFGSLNPHVGKWLIGFPVKLLMRIASPTHGEFFAFIDYSISPEENVAAGNVPSKDLLRRARLAPALFGVLCTLLVFSIAYHTTGNLLASVIAVALLLTNDLFVESTTRAMTDVHYNFFMLALAAYLICTLRKHTSLLLTSSAAGILAGLAFSVKITESSLVFVCFHSSLFTDA